jgi:NAD(P)H-hydrate epimerase
MKPAFTFEETRLVEKQIIETENTPSIILMENAGRNFAEYLIEFIPNLTDFNIYIICGKGNNAGDGFTIARHLALNGYDSIIVMGGEESALKGDALINFYAAGKFPPGIIEFIKFNEFEKILNRNKKNIVIDALLGTGIRGKLDDNMLYMIECLNRISKFKKTKVISVDVPSGLMQGEQVNPVINADVTITMGTLKTELLYGEGKEHSGEKIVVDIGIPDTLLEKYNSFEKYFVYKDDAAKLFPRRKKTSHKYSNGKLLIVGGSRNLTGAVIMALSSALKSGVGAVVVAAPHSVTQIINYKAPEVMTVPLDETDEGTIADGQLDKLRKRLDWADVVLIGPGLSLNKQTKSFTFDLISKCEKNLVIDADALTILSENLSVLKTGTNTKNIILTPHPGEFSKLSKLEDTKIISDRFTCVRNFVKEFNVNVVFKCESSFSCINDGKIYINTTGNENLATAGSGDVLSGLISSLLAQSRNPMTAMVCGNFIHGYCADLYFNKSKSKQSALLRNIIKLIPVAVNEIIS